MKLGNNLFQARKKVGLSQEMVAEKLGVSRQTISKWETDETLPDIYQSKKLAKLYNLTLDELIEFDVELKEIEQLINYVNSNVLEDSRFDDFIDEEMRNKIKDAHQTIQDNKEKLIGNEYSRIILNTTFDLEGEETFDFLKKIYKDLD